MKPPVMYFSYFSSMTFGFSIHTMKETVTLQNDQNMESLVPQVHFTWLPASVNGFASYSYFLCTSALGILEEFSSNAFNGLFSVFTRGVHLSNLRIERYLDI